MIHNWHSRKAAILIFADILLGGFGLFGGRGEYVGKIKLFDIGTEGGDQEGDGDLLSESDEIAYECGARQKYPILFDEAVTLHSGRWYVDLQFKFSKGQLISKCLFEKIVWTKIPTKNLIDSAKKKTGQIWFVWR